MKKLKAILGYLIAALMVPLGMFTLIGMGPVSEMIVNVTGVRISPLYTGGEVVRTVDHLSYETRIHRPVFDALIGETREGFVQIVWSPRNALPATVEETIDFDTDGTPDFTITLHPASKTATWQALTNQPFGMDGPYAIGEGEVEGVGVRIKLHNR